MPVKPVAPTPFVLPTSGYGSASDTGTAWRQAGAELVSGAAAPPPLHEFYTRPEGYGLQQAADTAAGNYVPYEVQEPVEVPVPVAVDASGNGANPNPVSSSAPPTAVSEPVAVPQVISVVPEDQQTGLSGQDTQIYNPDINYDDAFVASNNQIVGTLEPSNPEAITWIDPSFYTSQPIYSSSDFELGASQQPTDFVTNYSTDTDNASDIFANDYGAVIDLGYSVGEVDPGLAAAAGYTQPAVITPSVNNVSNYTDYVTNYTDNVTNYTDQYTSNSWTDTYGSSVNVGNNAGQFSTDYASFAGYTNGSSAVDAATSNSYDNWNASNDWF